MIQVYNILFMNNHNIEHIKIWYNSCILKYCDCVLANYSISFGVAFAYLMQSRIFLKN